MEDDEIAFQEKYFKFPSSFSLNIAELRKEKQITLNKNKLEPKCLSGELESTTEMIRLYNLLSYLHWMAEENEEAYDYNSKVLEQDKENIVALCNRAWMKRKDGDLTESKEKLDQIQKLAECKKHLVLQGKAEIAYSYSVFGPRYFSQSINLYEELLNDISTTEVDVNIVILWKLDLGIIYRKHCNYGNKLYDQRREERDTGECIKKAAALLHEVASSDCPTRWKGRCFASLAELSYSIFIGKQVTRSQEELFPEELADKDVQGLLNRALDMCAEDSHVLKICGKLFKYTKNLDKAEEVLRKSLSIRETSHGHHHLAMVLKTKLRNRILASRGGGQRTRNTCSSGHAVLHDGESQLVEHTHLGQGTQRSGLNSIRRGKTYSHQLSSKFRHERGRKLDENYVVSDEQIMCQELKNNICLSDQSSPVERGNNYPYVPSLTKTIKAVTSTWEPAHMPADKDRVRKEVCRSHNSNINQQRNVVTLDHQVHRAQHHDSPEQARLLQKATAKGFSYVFSIPDSEKESVKEILHHLDKGIELGNEWSSFEKGLILRQVNEPEKAFQTFLKTLKLREFSTTMVTVSCYEHLGACRRDLAREEADPEKKRILETDAVEYFRKAIEVMAYKASQELSYLKDGWMAYPTLKSMFQPQKRDVAKLKVLAELSKLLKKYGDTLDFFSQIIEMDENQEKDPKIMSGMIEIFLEKRQFGQAATLLDSYNCTEGKNKLSKDFCKMVYLECAFHLVSNKQKENAGQRIRQAFDIDCTKIPREEDDFDIFFLYDEEMETDEAGSPSFAFNLAKKLETFVPAESGLRITSNSDRVNPGSWRRKEQTQQMESSTHIVLILDTNEEPQRELKYSIKIAQEIDQERKSKLNLILVDDCTCPRELTAFPRIKFDTKLFQCEDDFIGWIRKFFFHLLTVCERKY